MDYRVEAELFHIKSMEASNLLGQNPLENPKYDKNEAISDIKLATSTVPDAVDTEMQELSEAREGSEQSIEESCVDVELAGAPMDSEPQEAVSLTVADMVEMENGEGPGEASIEMPSPASQRSREEEEICRICRDTPDNMTCMRACLCKGSVGFVHAECLEDWLTESGYSCCEICGFKYAISTQPRYTGFANFFAWLKYLFQSNEGTHIKLDAFVLVLLTLLVTAGFWIFAQGARNFISTGQMNPHGRIGHHHRMATSKAKQIEDDSHFKWIVVILIMLASAGGLIYITWMFIMFRDKFRLWHIWTVKYNRIVKVLPIQPLPQNETQEAETAT